MESAYEERLTFGYVTTIPIQLEEDGGSKRRFVPLRVGLMEKAISQLSLATATIPISDFNHDFPTVGPYTVIEVCDFGYHTIPESYEQIQTSITIADNILRTAYPGFVERIYVVNVFRMTTHLIPFYSNFSPGAVIKFLGNGTNLVEQLGEYVPENYLWWRGGAVAVGDVGGCGYEGCDDGAAI
ncbi:Non-classical phosphatidylinositol transfer protein (PITP) [Rhizina undulata]